MTSNSLFKSSIIYDKIKHHYHIYISDLHDDIPIFIVD